MEFNGFEVHTKGGKHDEFGLFPVCVGKSTKRSSRVEVDKEFVVVVKALVKEDSNLNCECRAQVESSVDVSDDDGGRSRKDFPLCLKDGDSLDQTISFTPHRDSDNANATPCLKKGQIVSFWFHFKPTFIKGVKKTTAVDRNYAFLLFQLIVEGIITSELSLPVRVFMNRIQKPNETNSIFPSFSVDVQPDGKLSLTHVDTKRWRKIDPRLSKSAPEPRNTSRSLCSSSYSSSSFSAVGQERPLSSSLDVPSSSQMDRDFFRSTLVHQQSTTPNLTAPRVNAPLMTILPFGSAPYNQPNDQPYDQSYNQSLDQSYSQAFDQSNNQPYDQSHSQPYGQSHNQPYDQSHSQPYDQSHNQMIDFMFATVQHWFSQAQSVIQNTPPQSPESNSFLPQLFDIFRIINSPPSTSFDSVPVGFPQQSVSIANPLECVPPPDGHTEDAAFLRAFDGSNQNTAFLPDLSASCVLEDDETTPDCEPDHSATGVPSSPLMNEEGDHSPVRDFDNNTGPLLDDQEEIPFSLPFSPSLFFG